MRNPVKAKKRFALALALLLLPILLAALLASCRGQQNLREIEEYRRNMAQEALGASPEDAIAALGGDIDGDAQTTKKPKEPGNLDLQSLQGDAANAAGLDGASPGAAGEGGAEGRAEFTGNAADYAEMPGPYGKSRNTRDYRIGDARDVTHENFLKLEVGMSLSDVKEIIEDAVVESSEYKDYTAWTFDGIATRICVDIKGGKLFWASYRDDYRICVDASDISMEKFLRLEEGMSIDEVKGILGGNHMRRTIGGTNRADSSRYVWFSDEGEIEVVFNASERVSAFMQEGLQYVPDSRAKHGPLTDLQLMENFAKFSTGTDSAELETLMGNYVPLFYTMVNLNYRNVVDFYKFDRRSGYDGIWLEFEFEDGKLFGKEAKKVPKALLPGTDVPSAETLKAGMTYSDVRGIVGDGFMSREYVTTYGSREEDYMWKLPGDEANYLKVTFNDGKITYDVYINISLFDEQ